MEEPPSPNNQALLVIVPDEMVDVLVNVITCPGVTGDKGLATKFAKGTMSFMTVMFFVAVHPFPSVMVTVVVPIEHTIIEVAVDTEFDQLNVIGVYDDVPAAFNVAQSPGQIIKSGEVKVAVGVDFTVATVEEPVHKF